MKIFLPALFPCALVLTVTTGCVSRHPHPFVYRRDAALAPVAIGPIGGNKVEATGVSGEIDRWVRTPKTGEPAAVAGQKLGLSLFVRNADGHAHTGVPWKITESGKEIASGKIETLAPFAEESVRTDYEIPGSATRDLHFICTVNPGNKMKEKPEGIYDNEIKVRLRVVPKK